MKKLFVSILALAAFAACQSNFNDVDYNTPEFGGVGNVGGSHTIYAEVGVGEETKATYGDDFSALWEEGDQIALLQEHADYGKTFSATNKIGIKNGIGTSVASFSGDISVDSTDPRIYHIVYPGSAASFNVTSSMSVEGVSYENVNESVVVGNDHQATGYGKYTYNSTINITVPTSQSGKWEPYLYASTSEAVKSEAIGAKTLNTLTGAIAIRAYEADGETPKQLKSIAVTATKPIAGAFSGSAQSVGNTVTITGAKAGWHTSLNSGKEESMSKALANLTSALQGYEATTTSVTKALSLSFAGEEYTVKADNTAWVAADENGVYTYHLNVAPFEGADLTIMATAVDGSTLVRTISGQSLAAAHRKGYVFKWEEATLSVGSIETWYDDCDTTVGLEGNTLYVNNLEVKGVSADHVLTLGVNIDGTLHEATAKSGVLTIDQIKISGMANDQHTVFAYAKVLVNGQEKELIGSVASKNVTSIPSLTNYSVLSSYSKDGTVAKNNNIDGRLLKVTANLTDDYFVKNGLATIEVYNGNTKLGNITNGEWSNTNAALGQYSCYVKIKFSNNYEIKSSEYTTHVTGIPCEADWTKADYSNWTLVTSSDKGDFIEIAGGEKGGVLSPSFYVPTSTNINAYVAASGTGDKNRAMYVAVVNGSATSLVTSGSSMDTTYNVGENTSVGYTTWTASSLTVSNGQKLSVAVYGGTFWGAAIYKGYLYRVKVEYK